VAVGLVVGGGGEGMGGRAIYRACSSVCMKWVRWRLGWLYFCNKFPKGIM